ncbi:NADPH-dependent 2,4-dienoyl-CoA reductase, sulfur reductase [Fulvimarina manganoxydans]|uniref:NADPH-dependent 2,4-dienoyl-CoA reductase, sulfur reductase n=1 Tax=Fulvimarina manganoxydans TaxID=937218 RepID=A0A1W2DSK6_9HYPH|nr:FAD-dependent oxidoreductase [Fulvimarina manganoxydans]SMD00430.1 NADPH-dependent 2,4-dienoyl-CoA reductase, sulfur reductase [Fulvimarina manganoxydans]
MQHDVLSLDELGADELKEVEANGVKLLLARDGDRVFATGATCTHKGAPLKNGTRIGNRVICPWHHAMFDLESGFHCEPPGQGCLARFETRIENGRILVEVPEDTDGHRPEVEVSERRTGGSKVFAIVGTGAAALACAQELVRRGFDGRIVMIGKEDAPPYDRTDLSKAYLQGKKGKDDLPLATREALSDLGIERVHGTVAAIDAAEKMLKIEGSGAPSELRYDACFAAPGSGSSMLPLDNTDMPNVMTLRSLKDGEALRQASEDEKEIVIIGSGFIGMEAAAALVQRDKTVTVVTPEEAPFAKKWGEEVAGQIADQHREKGVTLKTGAKVEAIEATDGMAIAVRLEGGERVQAGLFVLAVGAKPNLEIFGDLAKDGGVSVDGTLKAAEGLWAGGDVASFPLPGRGYATRIEHWRVAEQHGRHAAGAMLGEAEPFAGIPFFWSAQYGPIHYVGHAKDFDDIHIEGDLGEGSYTAYYVKDSKVVAGLGRGKADKTAELHALMLSQPTPSAASLKDAGWDPSALIGR